MYNQALHILLVDDDEADRLLFLDAFEILDPTIIIQTFNDGIQLLDYLARKDILLPDMVFLDINMPLKNGIQCVKEIRSDVRYDEMSIAIYSTSSSEKDMEKAFLSGADVYIHKPNDFNELLQILSNALKTVHPSRVPAR